MNRIYKIIWSKVRHCFTVVSESSRSLGKGGVIDDRCLESVISGIEKGLIAAAMVLMYSGQVLASGPGYDAGQAETGINSAIAIGSEATNYGGRAQSKGRNAIAIGSGAKAFEEQSIAIGSKGTAAYGNQSIAIGGDAVASGDDSIAIGGDDLDRVANDNPPPYNATGLTNIGFNTSPIAVKYYNHTGEWLVDVTGGSATRYIKTEANGAGSVVLGVQSKAIGPLSVAIGSGSRAENFGSTAFGIGSKATKDNSVALGAGSTTKKDAEAINGAAIGTVSYSGFAGYDNVMVGDQVSIGAADFERQIKHVAPGAITSASTDAVNGSQLFVITNSLQEQIKNSAFTIEGASSTLSVDDKIKQDDIFKITGDTSNTDFTKSDAGKNIYTIVNNDNTVNVGLAKDLKGLDSVVLGDDAADSNTVALTKNGINGGSEKITNVADGTNDTDGVNYRQLKNSAFTIEGASSTLSVDDEIKQDDTFKIVGDTSNTDFTNSDAGKNIYTIVNNDNTVTVGLAKELKELDSVVLGDNAADPSTVALTRNGVNAGSKKITNVAAGTNDTDGVNYEQLKDCLYNAQIQNQTLVEGVTPFSYIGDVDGTMMQLVRYVDSSGNVEWYRPDQMTGGVPNSSESPVTATNIHISTLNPNGPQLSTPTRVTNLAAGTEEDDAVNVNQLKNTVGALGGGAAVNPDGSIKGPSYTLTSGNPSTGGTVAYDNVGDALVGLNTAVNQPITFKADTNLDSGSDGSQQKLGSEFSILSGDLTNTNFLGNNLATEVKDNQVVIGMTKRPGFDQVTVTDGNNVVTVNGDTGTVNGLTNKNFDPNNISSGQAATEDQLVSIFQVANTGFNISANGENSSNVRPNDTVDFNNRDRNISIRKTNNELTFDLNPNLQLNSVNTGDTQINSNGLFINEGPSVTQNGINAADHKITNVAPGTHPGDAVNLSQLDEIGDDSNRGTATALAAASLPQAYTPGTNLITAGAGTYRGQSALAIGYSAISDNGKWIFKGSASLNQKDAGFSVGVGYQW